MAIGRDPKFNWTMIPLFCWIACKRLMLFALYGALSAMVLLVLMLTMLAVGVAFIGLLDTAVNFVIGWVL